jgi:hypothetical protein
MRGGDELYAAQAAAEQAVARASVRDKAFRDVGLDFTAAKKLARHVAVDAYSSFTEQLTTSFSEQERQATITQLQAAWLGGCLVGGYLERRKSLSASQLVQAAHKVNGSGTTSSVLIGLELESDPTQDIAAGIGMSLAPLVASATSLPASALISCAAMLSAVWLNGLVVVVAAARN